MHGSSDRNRLEKSNGHSGLGRQARGAFIIGLLLLVLAWPARAATAQGYFNAVVGDGSAASCTEAAFDSALAAVQAAQDGELSFNCGGPATIIFSGQKYINTQVIIIDGGGNITLSGGNITRLFTVLSGNLELRNITLANGYTPGHGGAILAQSNTSVYLLNSTIQNSRTDAGYGGGAILSFDTSTNFPAVEIENSVIRFNESGFGAINTVGRLVVRDSLIQGNKALNAGGGLSVGAKTEIVDSDIVDNEAAGVGGGMLIGKGAVVDVQGGVVRGNKGSLGGGIYNGGWVTLKDLTISENLALASSGGGLENYYADAVLSGVTFFRNSSLRFGGAIGNDHGNVNVQNSTLTENDFRLGGSQRGGGAISNYEGNVWLRNATLVDNVGVAKEAVYFAGQQGQLNLDNTIMVSRDGSNCGGKFATLVRYSLFDDQSCQSANATGNIYANPRLEDLADNGGPTLTHMPAANSPAVDTGDCIFSSDQRGVDRPQGARCDIGAVERLANGGTGQEGLFLPLILR